jgi:hypothetical protein
MKKHLLLICFGLCLFGYFTVSRVQPAAAQGAIILDGMRDTNYTLLSSDWAHDLASPGLGDNMPMAWADLTSLSTYQDSTYLYVYADLLKYRKAISSGTFALILETDGTSAGGSTDPWGNAISFAFNTIRANNGSTPLILGQSLRPEALVRGRIAGATSSDDGYTELLKWNGSSWTGVGTNWGGIPTGGTFGQNITYADDKGVEIRIPWSDLGIAAGSRVQFQLVTTQAGSQKGAYDSIPSDDQSVSTNDATTQTRLASIPLSTLSQRVFLPIILCGYCSGAQPTATATPLLTATATVMGATATRTNTPVTTGTTAPTSTASPTDIGASTGITVHYQGFETPYIYTWIGATQPNGIWPGTAMQPEGNGWFKAIIPFSQVSLIFNNGSGGPGNQTIDLTRTTGEWWFTNNAWTNYQPVSTATPTSSSTPTKTNTPPPERNTDLHPNTNPYPDCHHLLSHWCRQALRRPVTPAQAAGLWVSPSVSNVTVGQLVTVSLGVNANAQLLDSAEFHLDFDPTVLEVVQISQVSHAVRHSITRFWF